MTLGLVIVDAMDGGARLLPRNAPNADARKCPFDVAPGNGGKAGSAGAAAGSDFCDAYCDESAQSNVVAESVPGWAVESVAEESLTFLDDSRVRCLRSSSTTSSMSEGAHILAVSAANRFVPSSLGPSGSLGLRAKRLAPVRRGLSS